MNQVLDALSLRGLAPSLLGYFLSREDLRNSIRALTPVRPAALVWNGVYVLAHNDPFRLLPTLSDLAQW
jgi:hypothetical protein